MHENMPNTPQTQKNNRFKSITYFCLFAGISLISLSAFAGGHIFGGHKTKTANPNGVYSIGVHICGSLECPPVRIVEGKCDGTNMSKQWGVCVCDKGYVASGDHCDPCPAGQVSDGVNGCKTCPAGTYRKNENDTECSECPEGEHLCSGWENPGCAVDCCSNFTPTYCQLSCDSDTGTVTYAENGQGVVFSQLGKVGIFCYNGKEVSISSVNQDICEEVNGFWCTEGKWANTCSIERDCCMSDILPIQGVLPVGYYTCNEYTYQCDKQTGLDTSHNEAINEGKKCYINNSTDGYCYNGQCIDETQLSESECEEYDGEWCQWRDGSYFCSLKHNCCVKGADTDTPVVPGYLANCTDRLSCDSSTNYKWELVSLDGWRCVVGGYDEYIGFCQNQQCVKETELNESNCTKKDGEWCQWHDGSYFCSLNHNCCRKGNYYSNPRRRQCEDTFSCDSSTDYKWTPVSQEGSSCTGTNDDSTQYQGVCHNQMCCDINPATDCISGALVDGQCACAPAEDGATCTSWTNNECGLGYYCQFSPSDCGDSDRGNGTCTKITGGTTIIPAGDSEKTYLKGPQTDWWSAYSWCIGNNMNLVTGSIAGHSLSSSYENGDGSGDLYTYFGQDISFWTGHDAENSCDAWDVGADSNYECVYSPSRNHSRYALCE